MTLLAILAACYFLPTLIAMSRNATVGVFFLNLLLGWTIIGWGAALVWAFAAESGREGARKRKLEELAAMPDEVKREIWEKKHAH